MNKHDLNSKKRQRCVKQQRWGRNVSNKRKTAKQNGKRLDLKADGESVTSGGDRGSKHAQSNGEWKVSVNRPA